MKKEERVDRLDECCHAEMIVLTGSAHRRWVIPSTPLILSDLMVEKKQKLRAPTTMAGLVRYEETEESLIKLEPKHIVGIAIIIIILEFILFLLIPI